MPISTTTTAAISLFKEATDVNAYKWTYPHMEPYRIQESIIDNLFRTKPTSANIDEDIIFLKVSTLNLYYGTYIQATKQLAKGIYGLKIDSRLVGGDISLIEDIATKCTLRRNYSFATKYCACHQPDKFPIYDRKVGECLAHIIAKGNLSGISGTYTNVHNMMKKDYAFYRGIYDAFIQQYGLTSLSYREVDWYLWTANKCLTSRPLLLFSLV